MRHFENTSPDKLNNKRPRSESRDSFRERLEQTRRDNIRFRPFSQVQDDNNVYTSDNRSGYQVTYDKRTRTCHITDINNNTIPVFTESRIPATKEPYAAIYNRIEQSVDIYNLQHGGVKLVSRIEDVDGGHLAFSTSEETRNTFDINSQIAARGPFWNQSNTPIQEYQPRQSEEKGKGKQHDNTPTATQPSTDDLLRQQFTLQQQLTDHFNQANTGSSYVNVEGLSLNYHDSQSMQDEIPTHFISQQADSPDAQQTKPAERDQSPSRERVPWKNHELEKLIFRIKRLKDSNPDAKLTQETDGDTLKRLQTHRFSTDEWKTVLRYMKQYKIPSTDKTYQYLRTYSRPSSTIRFQNAATKQNKTSYELQRGYLENRAAKQNKTPYELQREYLENRAAKQDKTVYELRKGYLENTAIRQDKTPYELLRGYLENIAAKQDKTVYELRKGYLENTATRQDKTLRELLREYLENESARQNKTVQELQRERNDRSRKKMKDPKHRHDYLKEQFQRREKDYDIASRVLDNKISQAETFKETKKLQEEKTALQKKWEAFQQINQTERKKLLGLLDTQDKLNQELSSQQLDSDILEHMQQQVDNLETQIQACINWQEESEIDYLLRLFGETHDPSNPNPDQFYQD